MAGNNKRLKKKMAELLKEEKRPMSTAEIVSVLSNARYPYTPSCRRASMLLRAKPFVKVGYCSTAGYEVALWYLAEESL
jgi:hypothetical protein